MDTGPCPVSAKTHSTMHESLVALKEFMALWGIDPGIIVTIFDDLGVWLNQLEQSCGNLGLPRLPHQVNSWRDTDVHCRLMILGAMERSCSYPRALPGKGSLLLTQLMQENCPHEVF